MWQGYKLKHLKLRTEHYVNIYCKYLFRLMEDELALEGSEIKLLQLASKVITFNLNRSNMKQVHPVYLYSPFSTTSFYFDQRYLELFKFISDLG